MGLAVAVGHSVRPLRVPTGNVATDRADGQVRASVNDMLRELEVVKARLDALEREQVVFKTADQQSVVTALADVTDLQWRIAPEAFYWFEFLVAFETAAGTTGINLSVNGPGSPKSIHWMTEVMVSGVQGTDGIESKAHNAYDDAHLTASIDAANTSRTAVLRGLLHNGPTAGLLTLRLATEIATSAAMVKRGSVARLRRLL